ncbi:hypothetical protein EV196_109127 [Mariniflexile fucanivorans]|uniref:Uncharacterized protein n=1 Tax=Mariniflexile fucanivorans TaxID=264023 RepID=A0A4R1RCD2_9FLAO|nr:hypothetical protein EV196_109127 [Mariniflexile fucanivorans]
MGVLTLYIKDTDLVTLKQHLLNTGLTLKIHYIDIQYINN